jgi:hypothetical protein
MFLVLDELECCALVRAVVNAPAGLPTSWAKTVPGLQEAVSLMINSKRLAFEVPPDIAFAFRSFASMETERLHKTGELKPVSGQSCDHTAQEHETALRHLIRRLPSAN